MARRFLSARIVPRSLMNLKRNFRSLKKDLLKVAEDHAERESEILFEKTGRIVPYLTGGLFNARFRRRSSKKEDQPTWQVGYDTNQAPHAWAVHQIPNRVHPTRGPYPDDKQDHFLSVPRDELAQTYQARAQVKLNAAIRRFRPIRSR